jgi:hypothetical protein
MRFIITLEVILACPAEICASHIWSPNRHRIYRRRTTALFWYPIYHLGREQNHSRKRMLIFSSVNVSVERKVGLADDRVKYKIGKSTADKFPVLFRLWLRHVSKTGDNAWRYSGWSLIITGLLYDWLRAVCIFSSAMRVFMLCVGNRRLRLGRVATGNYSFSLFLR